MTRAMRSSRWTILAAALAAACSEPDDPSDCSGQVTIQVTEGPLPRFDWSPACEVAALTVSNAAITVWSINSGVGRNELRPPVDYGTLPPESFLEFGPEPLQPGFGYFVRLYRLEHEDDELVHEETGEAVFRH
jgi:hypothetical protein